jgi:hypothetical protein
MDKTWKYRWSGEVAAATVVTLSIIVAMCLFFMFFLWSKMPADAKWIVLAMLGVLGVVFVWTACLTPRSLAVSSKGVVLKRLAGSLKIPAEDIVEMREVEPGEVRGMIRIAGSGGFCGYIGRFRSRKLGNFVLNITERRNLVMVRTAKKKYIFNGRLGDSGISG